MNGGTGLSNLNIPSVSEFTANLKLIDSNAHKSSLSIFQNDQLIFNYLDTVRPENISNVKNKKFTNIIRQLSEQYPELCILNAVVTKLYNKKSERGEEVNSKRSSLDLHQAISKSSFESFSETNIGAVKSFSETSDVLIDIYSTICNTLLSLTDNLVSYYKLMSADISNKIASHRVLNNGKRRLTWHQSLNKIAIKTLKIKALKTCKYLTYLISRQTKDVMIKNVIQHYTEKCAVVLDRITNIINFLEQECEEKKSTDSSPPVIFKFKDKIKSDMKLNKMVSKTWICGKIQRASKTQNKTKKKLKFIWNKIKEMIFENLTQKSSKKPNIYKNYIKKSCYQICSNNNSHKPGLFDLSLSKNNEQVIQVDINNAEVKNPPNDIKIYSAYETKVQAFCCKKVTSLCTCQSETSFKRLQRNIRNICRRLHKKTSTTSIIKTSRSDPSIKSKTSNLLDSINSSKISIMDATVDKKDENDISCHDICERPSELGSSPSCQYLHKKLPGSLKLNTSLEYPLEDLVDDTLIGNDLLNNVNSSKISIIEASDDKIGEKELSCQDICEISSDICSSPSCQYLHRKQIDNGKLYPSLEFPFEDKNDDKPVERRLQLISEKLSKIKTVPEFGTCFKCDAQFIYAPSINSLPLVRSLSSFSSASRLIAFPKDSLINGVLNKDLDNNGNTKYYYPDDYRKPGTSDRHSMNRSLSSAQVAYVHSCNSIKYKRKKKIKKSRKYKKCGKGIQTESIQFACKNSHNGDHEDYKPDKKKSVCWALTKVLITHSGSQIFEVLEVSCDPPRGNIFE